MSAASVRSLVALLALVVTLCMTTRSAPAHGPSSAPGQAAADAARSVGEKLTTELVRISVQYHTAAGGQKARLEQDLLAAARTREQQLLRLVEMDPAEVLRLAVPSRVRSGVPASVQVHIEEATALEGTLEILHEDGANYSRFHYYLHTKIGTLRLSFVGGDTPDHLITGAHVRVKGVRVGQTLAAGGSTSTGSVQTLTTAPPNTFGAQRTLMILVTFSDKTTPPYTVDYAKSVAFTTTSNFDMENSYGQTWLTGDVVGWYPIAMASTSCDYTTLASQAKQAATAAGVTLSTYTHLVYGFPKNACTWWGLGSVGGNPSQAWVNGSLQLGVLGHEMGHNLGLYHSHSLDCGAVVVGGSCTTSDYGDSVDIMGGSYTAHFNAFQKERLGWLNYGSSPALTTVTTTGTYVISPYETVTSDPKALKLVQSVNASTGRTTWYYVEYRQGIGFDGFVSNNTNLKGGVVLHLGTEATGNSSYLLDLTPATSSWSDPALAVGQTYYDADAGVTISPVWADSSGVGVSVSYAPLTCVRSAPTVAISPSQSAWVTAGSTAVFTVAVTNNDNAGCTASSFSLQAMGPTGWVETFGASPLNINPGTSASTSLSVTSAVSATDGFNDIGVTASDTANSRSGSASATYVVMSSLDTSVWTDKTTYSGQATVTITTSVRANGAAVSGATVSVAVTKPDGSVANQTATTDANGNAVVKLRLKRQDPRGTYQAMSTVVISGGVTGEATTSFILQ
jgi:hypothetical protein